MIQGIDHIGVFVTDLEDAVRVFCETYDLPRATIVDVPERRKRVAWIEFGGCALELMEDYDPRSELHVRAEMQGSFIHHFALRASEIEKDIETLESKGCARNKISPAKGLRGKKVQFVNDKGLAMLVEITES